MQCPQCEMPVDYRFSTTCLCCNFELTPVDRPHACQTKGGLTLAQHLVNATITTMASAAGLIIGAVMVYFGGAIVSIFLSKLWPGDGPSCGEGTMISFLLLFAGANLGSVLGGICGHQNRLYKSG